jgi:predicted transcriptional regulator
MLKNTSSLELTIKMPFELQEQTQHLARQQSKTVSEIIHTALTYYIDNYQKTNQPVSSELNLEQGRKLMRELGAGLGYSTSPPHDVARNHDL